MCQVLGGVTGEQNQLSPPSGSVGSRGGGAGSDNEITRLINTSKAFTEHLLCARHRGAKQAWPLPADQCVGEGRGQTCIVRQVGSTRTSGHWGQRTLRLP